MSENLNILILSCGTRNKIIQYFKNELSGKGKVIAADSSKLAPALYDADNFYIVPNVDEVGYLKKVLSICENENVKAVLSLIDPELSVLARFKQDFLDVGTLPIISDFEEIELFFDKYKTVNFLANNGFKTIKSYLDKKQFYSDLLKGTIDYPVFVKPLKGSASLNINKVYSKDEIESLFNKHNNLIIQEFMNGKEYGVDVYIDMISKEPVSIFIKEKLKMRAGETDKSVSVNDEVLFELIKAFVKKTNLIGIIDIDIFKVKEKYYISEVNPRFGGGYLHAHEGGANMIDMIINNINKSKNPDKIGNYKQGTKMLKYNDFKILT